MQTMTHTLAGTECVLRVVETAEDARTFVDWARTQRLLGLDTETTGLDPFHVDFRIRLVQMGTETEGWVLPAERFQHEIVQVLADEDTTFVLHNATYDLLALDARGVIDLEDLAPKCFDTRILAHHVDNLPQEEGGTGLGLKALATVYLDPAASDGAEELSAAFREMGVSKAEGWARIPLDHPAYTRYAALDPILAIRLFRALTETLKARGQSMELVSFDHEIAQVCAAMQRNGLRVDRAYLGQLAPELADEAERYRHVAAAYGVENVNSQAQLIEALLGMGEVLTKRSPSGKSLSVDASVLLPLADLQDKSWQRLHARVPNPLAEAVVRVKRAEKWKVAYVDSMLDMSGSSIDGRVHASINSLAAKTGRMSVSSPALQQLPSNDWRIRRAIMSDPGNEIISCDFSSVEFRVLAGLLDQGAMKDAILDGLDLHDFTARMLFGDGFTKAQRKRGKAVGLGKIYGQGSRSLGASLGIPQSEAKALMDQYDAAFPEIPQFAAQVSRQVRFDGYVQTPTGRRIQVPRDRGYKGINALCQSWARDLFCQALLGIADEIGTDLLMLPIHDEMLVQAPAAEAEEIARIVGECMTLSIGGADGRPVPITSDPQVVGWTWAAEYASSEMAETFRGAAA